MIKSGILEKNNRWNNAIDLKLQHIQMKTDFGKQIFFSIFGFFTAIIIAIIFTSSYIIDKLNIMWFFIILIGLFILSWALISKIAIGVWENIDDHYNRLFYEILIGDVKDIKPMSGEEYQRLTRGF